MPNKPQIAACSAENAAETALIHDFSTPSYFNKDYFNKTHVCT
jgi:hypothetical protein